VCDDTYSNFASVCTEHGVTDQFQTAYGYAFNSGPTGPGAAWYADMLAIFQSLHVVINNRQSTVGGGGTPLQPPPPPICSIGVQQPVSGATVQAISFVLSFLSCMTIYLFN